MKPTRTERPIAGTLTGTAIALALATGLTAMLSGCSDEPILRDDYWGRSWFEPDKVMHPVPRDAYGNPILEKRK